MQSISRKTLQNVVASLGGEDVVVTRLQLTHHSLRAAYDARRFPAPWHGPFCEMASEAGTDAPPISLFKMRELLPEATVSGGAQ